MVISFCFNRTSISPKGAKSVRFGYSYLYILIYFGFSKSNCAWAWIILIEDPFLSNLAFFQIICCISLGCYCSFVQWVFDVGKLILTDSLTHLRILTLQTFLADQIAFALFFYSELISLHCFYLFFCILGYDSRPSFMWNIQNVSGIFGFSGSRSKIV